MVFLGVRPFSKGARRYKKDPVSLQFPPILPHSKVKLALLYTSKPSTIMHRLFSIRRSKSCNASTTSPASLREIAANLRFTDNPIYVRPAAQINKPRKSLVRTTSEPCLYSPVLALQRQVQSDVAKCRENQIDEMLWEIPSDVDVEAVGRKFSKIGSFVGVAFSVAKIGSHQNFLVARIEV